MIASRDMQLERMVVALLENGKYFDQLGKLDLQRLMTDARALQDAIKTRDEKSPAEKPEGAAKP
jgi:hypothetical protein